MLDWQVRGDGDSRRLLLSVVPMDKLVRILRTLFDEDAFLSAHGLRSISKRHTTPYTVPGMPAASIEYEPPSLEPPCTAGTPTGADRCGSRSTT